MKTLTKQGLEQKIEKIVKENIYGYECTDCHGGGAKGQDKCIYCNGTGIVRWELELGRQKLVSLMLDSFEELVGDKKTNENYTKQLNVPSSDYSWGHSHGFNQAIDELRAKIQELRGDK